MPTENARGHVVPAPDEASFTRATIFEQFGLSINDIVPVATVSDRTALVAALTAKGIAPSATRPLVVIRANAPGLHRIEYTFDGQVWLPASGVLRFPTLAERDSFSTAYPGLLSRFDRCVVGDIQYEWSGSGWRGELIPITPNSAVWRFNSAGLLPGSVQLVGTRVFMQGTVANAQTATVIANTDYPVGSIPVELAPAADVFFITASTQGSSMATLSVKADGRVVFTPRFAGTFPQGQMITFLDGLNWPRR